MMIETLEMVFNHKQIVHISSHTIYQSSYMGKKVPNSTWKIVIYFK